MSNVHIVGRAESYTIGQLHEALKGATIIANHAGQRIKELEAALRVARGYVLAATKGAELYPPVQAERDLATIDEALGLKQ